MTFDPYAKEHIENVRYRIDSYGRLAHAVREIERTYGDNVSIYEKRKSLIKYGRNTDLSAAEETVWLQGGHEVLPTDNTIDSVSSSNAGDTQELVVEGHTLSGSELTFVSQTVTLTGQTPVSLSIPLYRVNRAYNNNSVNIAGTVYIFESGGSVVGGVPQTAADIHALIVNGDNQTLKCATSISNDEYWIITQISCGVNRQQVRSVDFRLQVKQFGKVYRTIYPLSVHSNSGTDNIVFDPCLIVPKNSDVRVVAISSGTSTQVEAIIHGYLAKVQST